MSNKKDCSMCKKSYTIQTLKKNNGTCTKCKKIAQKSESDIKLDSKLISEIKLQKVQIEKLNKQVTTLAISVASLITSVEQLQGNNKKSSTEIKEIKKNPLICNICMDNDISIALHCGHIFCTICPFRFGGKCPTCRETFDDSGFIQIYF